MPCYEITRDGFVFLCMGFTGAQAALWKEKYIAAFNRLEAEVHSRAEPAVNAALLQQLQTAYLETHPEAAALLKYAALDLNHREIGRLLEVSAQTVRDRLKKLAAIGLSDYKPSEKLATAGRKGLAARREQAAFAASQQSLSLEG